MNPVLPFLGPPPIDPDAAREAADDILSDPAYAQPEQSLLDRAVEWVLDRLGSVFEGAAGGGPGDVIGWLFFLALVAGALWLLVRALRVPALRRRAAPESLEYGTEAPRDPARWLGEAARLAAGGDHRGALRCRHQALVAALVDSEVVDDVPGRTAGEYRRLVLEVAPSLDQGMTTVTESFDEVWYGGAPVDAEGYGSFVRTCERIESSIEAIAERAVDARTGAVT